MDPAHIGTVSIITPAFNSARTIARACESVRAQSYPHWEHIIVDDGSTDRTGAILRQIAAVDPRVRFLTTTNRGQSAALNAGVAMARSPHIAFLDGDDEYLPNHLAEHIHFMQQHPSVDLVWGGVEVITNEAEDAFVPDLDRGAGWIHVSECVVQGTIFARREVFEDLRFTEDRSVWYQDYEFVQRATARYSIARFPHATYRYYRNGSTSLVDVAKQSWPAAQQAAAASA